MKTQTSALHQVQQAFDVYFSGFAVRDSWWRLVVWWLHDCFVINVVIISTCRLPTITLRDSWNFNCQFVDYQNHILKTAEDDSVDAIKWWCTFVKCQHFCVVTTRSLDLLSIVSGIYENIHNPNEKWEGVFVGWFFCLGFQHSIF